MIAESAEVIDLRFHLMKLRLSEGAHLHARRSARVAHTKNTGQFVKRESDLQRPPHKFHALYRFRWILPVPSGCASRAQQDADALVMPKRIGANTSDPRELA